jgi:hypothetical protein
LSNEDTTQSAITYYWIDGGKELKVEFKVKIDGKEHEGSEDFDVQRPEATLTSETTRNAPETKGVQLGDPGLPKQKAKE